MPDGRENTMILYDAKGSCDVPMSRGRGKELVLLALMMEPRNAAGNEMRCMTHAKSTDLLGTL